MNRTKKIFREIKNYFFLRRVLSKESNAPDSRWQTYKLRKNWFGRIYTVISLREEEAGEEEMVKNWLAMERMKPINEYLTDLGVHEIIFPSIEKIENSRSYLVVYSPLFRETTLKWFFWRIVLLVITALALNYLKNII
jgi:hypothetical protein